MPTDYFSLQRIERWKHELTNQYVPGALGIPIVDERARVMSNGKTISKMVRNDAPFTDPVMYPSLLEWREYLGTVYEGLFRSPGQKRRDEKIIEMDEKYGMFGRNDKIIIGPTGPNYQLMKKIVYHRPWSNRRLKETKEISKEDYELLRWMNDVKDKHIEINGKTINVAAVALIVMKEYPETGLHPFVFCAPILQGVSIKEIDLQDDKEEIEAIAAPTLPILDNMGDRGLLLRDAEGNLFLTELGKHMAEIVAAPIITVSEEKKFIVDKM